jgi:hypothetical protein
LQPPEHLAEPLSEQTTGAVSRGVKDQPDSGLICDDEAQAASSQATVLSSISAIDRIAAQSAEQFGS